ncbi:phosphoribosyltransferase [Priestia megaterium]|uniref:phosphoribosyltransferase n=1 Tax=Priestia megaterium TaxID=1404 RepID=UPI002FFD9869
MGKNIVLPRLTIFNESYEMYEGIEELLQSLNQDGHELIVITHQQSSVIIMTRIFQEVFDFEIICEYRSFVKNSVNTENAQDYILIGSSDEDLHLTASKKMLLINPGWSVKKGELPARYAITLHSPWQLLEAVRLISNQSEWYFNLEVPEDTRVLALTSANTRNYDVNTSEREVLDGFRSLLKAGERSYFNTLYFHLISGVMKNPELREVEIWATFPSSSSNKINRELEELKERCRYLTGRRMAAPLFKRHLTVGKSHHTNDEERLRVGCKKHFDSIVLNDFYKEKNRIRGKVVCVLDDYLTNGISFETARNLLLEAGARKVILVALGRYRKGAQGIYQHEVYNLSGVITKPGYNYKLVSRQRLVGTYNEEARNEVRRIHEILNG